MDAMEFLSIPKTTKYSTFGDLNNNNTFGDSFFELVA